MNQKSTQDTAFLLQWTSCYNSDPATASKVETESYIFELST